MSAVCFTCLSTEEPLSPMKNAYWDILKALLSPQVCVEHFCFTNKTHCLCGKCAWLLHGVSVFRDDAVKSFRQLIEQWNQNEDLSTNNGIEEEAIKTETLIADADEAMLDDPLVTHTSADKLFDIIKVETIQDRDSINVEELCALTVDHSELSHEADSSKLDADNDGRNSESETTIDGSSRRHKRKKMPLTTAEKSKRYREKLKRINPEKYLEMKRKSSSRAVRAYQIKKKSLTGSQKDEHEIQLLQEKTLPQTVEIIPCTSSKQSANTHLDTEERSNKKRSAPLTSAEKSKRYRDKLKITDPEKYLKMKIKSSSRSKKAYQSKKILTHLQKEHKKKKYRKKVQAIPSASSEQSANSEDNTEEGLNEKLSASRTRAPRVTHLEN